MSITKKYTTDEVAQLFDVEPRTIHNWRHRGNGPAYVKIGHKVWYTQAAIDAFVASRTFKRTKSKPVKSTAA